MRIAFLLRELRQVTGAEKSLMTLARHLDSSHTVSVFGYPENNDIHRLPVVDDPFWFSIHSPIPRELERILRMHEFYHRFEAPIHSFSPHLLISQFGMGYTATKLAQQLDVPQIHFLRDYSLLSDETVDQRPIVAAVNKLFSSLRKSMVASIFEYTNTFVANSCFLRDRYREYWNVDSTVIYPFVDVSEYKVSSPGDAILHVTPTHEKGIDITLDVAERITDEKFIVVGADPESETIGERLRHLDNVAFLGYVSDMKCIYERTRLVIMPSRWDEPFGRIPIEAGISGIPTVSSGRGGLKESVGSEQRTVPSNKPREYVSAIRETLHDYSHYSEAAKANAESKRAEIQLAKFDRLLQEMV